jgi:hypothetical protein
MNSKALFSIVLIIVACTLIFTGVTCAADSGVLTFDNDFIKIVVRTGPEETGRFALDTTGGNPLRLNDDNKPLIYGRPFPWTSYTTIRIGQENFVFGGSTNLRAGSLGLIGEEVTSPVIREDGSIVTEWKMRDILVSQVLRIATSSTTGEPDTVRIEYTLTNLGTVSQDVGLRIMLDTMLGDNDGAPFRLRDQAVQTITSYTKEMLPAFWQAFDSLTDPRVIAQGTFMDKDATPPDKVYFTDWGTLADNIWECQLEYGEPFIRKGESEPDSAIAMFWMPSLLSPGESRTYVTYYGMGDVSIAAGSLGLGVTSPAEVIASKINPKPFQIIAYIENTADERALQVAATLNLPKGLELVKGQSITKALGNILPGRSTQVVWDVIPNGDVIGNVEYKVSVTSTNTPSNSVSRSIRLLMPPKLEVKLDVPSELEVWEEQLLPFFVRARIQNVGGTTAYNVRTVISMANGIILPEFERAMKYIGPLAVGETFEVTWRGISDGHSGSGKCELVTEAIDTETTVVEKNIVVPELHAKITVERISSSIKEGDIVVLNIFGTNIEQFYSITFDLEYDPDILRAIRISRGTVFVQGDELTTWNPGRIDNASGVIRDISGVRLWEAPAFGSLATVSFRTVSSGHTAVAVKNVIIRTADGMEIMATLEDGFITVQ